MASLAFFSGYFLFYIFSWFISIFPFIFPTSSWLKIHLKKKKKPENPPKKTNKFSIVFSPLFCTSNFFSFFLFFSFLPCTSLHHFCCMHKSWLPECHKHRKLHPMMPHSFAPCCQLITWFPSAALLHLQYSSSITSMSRWILLWSLLSLNFSQFHFSAINTQNKQVRFELIALW